MLLLVRTSVQPLWACHIGLGLGLEGPGNV